ncbi:ABC transporter permease subunit [Amaricoccus sp.]|uniref:ABC transporter permease n=1 Tax=Amaricoccus sp. TaxID=1872485 RepID=UPI001B617CEF|nr:ABC transporter permease subunit [Amaricoccus sp.]MBP7000919.1 ABC transporter permease subunit [Amaricoccus sp.]
MTQLIAYAPLLAKGALITIALALLSLAVATALGALGAAGKIAGGRIARMVVQLYTTIVRGVPDLVMILLIYFGGQRLVNIVMGVFGAGPLTVSPFVAGMLAIGFIYGAYLTETFRGAYMTIPRGQTEAAQALGLGSWPMVRKVIAPQLVRFALPGYANVWQVLVKSTAVVSVIGLQDLVGLANDAGKTARQPFVFFTAVLLVYLLFTFLSQQVFGWLERRHALVGHHAR